jgi:hypothetical protein
MFRKVHPDGSVYEPTLRPTVSAKDDRDRVMWLTITKEAFLSVLRGDTHVADGVFPPDARITDVGYDTARRTFVVLVQSAQFEPVPVGEMPPSMPLLAMWRVAR